MTTIYQLRSPLTSSPAPLTLILVILVETFMRNQDWDNGESPT